MKKEMTSCVSQVWVIENGQIETGRIDTSNLKIGPECTGGLKPGNTYMHRESQPTMKKVGRKLSTWPNQSPNSAPRFQHLNEQHS